MKLSLEDIWLSGKNAFVQYGGKQYSIPPKRVRYHASEIRNVRSEEDRRKIVHYLLSGDSPDISLYFDKSARLCFKSPSLLKDVKVSHDPVPEHGLEVGLFDSLQSAQWHVLCHGIADHWIAPRQPRMLFRPVAVGGFEKIGDDRLPVIWNRFRSEVRCGRWGCVDLPNLKDPVKKWLERYKQQKDENKYFRHGCFDCINKQGVDMFLRCCDFLREYRNAYLGQIREWIVDSIQDNRHVRFYANPELPFSEIILRRRHLHTEDRERSFLIAYEICARDDGLNDVYVLIFMLREGGQTERYGLVSAHGLISGKSEAEALKHIKKNAVWRKEKKREKFGHCCHVSNWEASFCSSI